jgi:hypothetical protein
MRKNNNKMNYFCKLMILKSNKKIKDFNFYIWNNQLRQVLKIGNLFLNKFGLNNILT